ncbi:MAG: aminopeptidase [Anaerolineales bacterium]
MSDPRVRKLAQVLVDHSARIQPGDRVLLEATFAAEPLVRELYALILQRGGHPQPLFTFPGQEKLFYTYASDAQLDFMPAFMHLAYEQFESRIRIHSAMDTRELMDVEPARQGRRQKATAAILETQMRRGAAGEFKWVTTLFPTEAYAREAGMSMKDYEDFVFQACFATLDDPVAAWKQVETEQQRILEWLKGRDQVVVRGPNVDLRLSIKNRVFMNSSGRFNMPDGEVYTGPVEDSVNGWVRFTYPAIYGGRVVEGVQLRFEQGRVVEASATSNEAFLLQMLDSDPGARYLGEFAIGTNFQIDRFIGHILFDEKIGGTFHMALGAGYPETGSHNKSVIHWDMICDLRTDSEIRVDGDLLYHNGAFVI